MILIITHKEDYTVDLVVEKLNALKIDYYRFNCEDVDEQGYSLKLGHQPHVLLGNIQRFNSVWFRRTKLPEITTDSCSKKLFILNDYDYLLSNLYPLIEAKKWMSEPKHIYRAENKLWQLKIANSIGYTIPNTIVTSSKEEIKQFARSHSNRIIIIKPITHGRLEDPSGVSNIFTNLVEPEHIENIEEFDITPCIFQEYIEKKYELRITVVADQVFAAKVDSQLNENSKVDWRKEKIRFTPYNLPMDVSLKCISIVKKMNLNFGAIDLIMSKKGEYVFLEINPNGQWGWIEFDTGMPIAMAIINFLKK